MSKYEKLLHDLRKAEPLNRRLMLHDIAKDYGEGFAETLRKQVEGKPEKVRR